MQPTCYCSFRINNGIVGRMGDLKKKLLLLLFCLFFGGVLGLFTFFVCGLFRLGCVCVCVCVYV